MERRVWSFVSYKQKEYNKLTHAQQDELFCCEKGNKKGGDKEGKAARTGKGSHDKIIMAAFKQQIESMQQEAEEEEKTKNAFQNYILSVVQGGKQGKRPKVSVDSTDATEDANVSNLNKILKKVRFTS